MDKEQLIEKLNKEFENFKKEQLVKDKEEIFDNAIEIVLRYFIHDYICNRAKLTDEQIEALTENDEDQIIDIVYNNYIEDREFFDIGEALEEYIDDLLDAVVEVEEQE